MSYRVPYLKWTGSVMLSLDLQWSFIMNGDRIAFEASSKNQTVQHFSVLDFVKDFPLFIFFGQNHFSAGGKL